MNTTQRTSDCRIVSIASARPAKAPQSLLVLSLIRGQRAINLAELARSIHADHDLCKIVTEAAFQEFGPPGRGVEDAIVLMGRERLCTLLSAWMLQGCSVTKRRRTLHRTSIAPSAKLCLLETFQGEPK